MSYTSKPKMNQLAFKIIGQKEIVQQAVKKLKELYPLHIESKTYSNNDGTDGVHLWFNAAVLEEGSSP